MKRVAGVVPLLLLLLAGCAGGSRIEPISMTELSRYREARLAAQARARLVATVHAPALQAEPPPVIDTAMREHFRARGRELAALAGLRLTHHYPLDSLGLWVYVYEADNERTLRRGMNVLHRQPDVDDVQRDALYRTRDEAADAASPSPGPDPLAPLQSIPAAQLDQLHQLATGAGVLVAVIDTGVDLDHEDLAGANLDALDMVVEGNRVPPETHATAVTGIILAQAGNGVGIRGIAPNARVLVLRACRQEPVSQNAYCNTFTLARALSTALESGADVVNLSLTGPLDPLLGRLVANLVANEVIVVAANADELEQGPFPATLPGVIAATSRPLLAENPGPLYAPGTDVITLLPGDRYGLRNGSSISAAQVSAVLSLFLERDPTLSATALETILRGENANAAGFDGLVEALSATAR